MLLRPIGLSVPNAGEAKAAGLIQQLGAGPGLGHSASCITCTGRWTAGEAVVSATSLDRPGVTRYADVVRKISANFQPEANMLRWRSANFGTSYTTVVLKICRRSDENVPPISL